MKIKSMKKILYLFILFVIISTLSFGTVFAADTQDTVKGTTTLELVEDNICDININDIGKFEKKITDFDSKNKSATLTLTLENIKTREESQKPAEIFLVIDNSSSMVENNVNGITRKQAVINSANTLVDKLFEANTNAKVGVVSFTSLDSAKGETEGTINDAKLHLALSNSKEDVKSSIATISSSKTGPRTNIEAGITIASQNYSSNENTNRYIVLLTDGVPNNALDGSFATYVGNVGARTKAKLQEIEGTGINIVGAMIGLDSEKVETQSGKTYKTLAEEVFGTVAAPTISKYYYIQDTDIENTIVNDIYKGIVSVTDNSLKNITVKDYFPQEIIDNFNFEYTASPNIGKVSEKVDTTDNSITWTIELLKEGEIATLSYKLTLKDDYDKNIIDKVLPTNKKVDITADNNGTTIEKTSDVSPKVKVLYKEIIVEDNTVANTVIPQAGQSDTTIAFTVIVSIIAIISIIRLIYLKNKNI